MSTADKKAGHGAAWANLIVCGGISWAVSLWHATHATTSGNKFLAVLAATAPVVTAAFASHHVAKKGVKMGKRIMTCIVFIMGMALSVKAQAQSIGPIVGGVELGVVFALMLDVSTFLALSSIMSRPVAGASTEASNPVSNERPLDTPVDVSLDTRTDASKDTPVDTRVDTRVDARRTPPVDTPRTRTKAAPRTRTPAAKTTAADTRAKARELLKANPDMNGNELAAALERKPAGSIRTMRSELLEELRDAGELPSVRAIGA